MYKIFLIFIIVYSGFAQKTNFNIQDSLIKESINSILSELNNQNDPVQIYVENHTADWLIEQNVVNKLIEKNFKVTDSADYKIEFFIKNITPVYISISQDSLIRNIKLDIAYNISESGNILYSDEITDEYSDFITIDNINQIEDNNYVFTKGELPDIPVSFWTEYLEPVIVVSAAVITVILFFTVRSG